MPSTSPRKVPGTGLHRQLGMLDETGILGGVPCGSPASYSPASNSTCFQDHSVRSSTADVEVTQQFWRRPLAVVLGAFADAGLKVDRVAGPQLSAEALRLFPDDLGLSSECRCPSFTGCGISLEAVKHLSPEHDSSMISWA